MKNRIVGEDYYDIGTFTGETNMDYFIQQHSKEKKEVSKNETIQN